MEIVLAHWQHLEEVSRLFDQYRVFYQQPLKSGSSDKVSSRAFLEQ
jgi:hypothetical protein